MFLIQTVLAFLFILLVLVSIHEWGHFIVARMCGVKVLRFSVGFGKPLYSLTDKHGTEFALAPIPLGGYVKMLDETAENITPEDKNKTFESRKTWQQVAILAAGPVANFVLAFFVFWWLALQEVTIPNPIIGEVQPDSPAAYAGVEAGQQIIAIDGVATPGRKEVFERLTRRLGESGTIMLTVQYPEAKGLTYDMEIVIENLLQGEEAPNPLAGIGLTFFTPQIPAQIGAVLPDSAADLAGLKAGDEIIAIDNLVVNEWQDWAQYIQQRPNQSVMLSVKRDEELLVLPIVPSMVEDEQGKQVGRIGVSATRVSWPQEMLVTRKLGVFMAMDHALKETWATSSMIVVSIKKLLLGHISVKNLSGPVGIAQVAGESARAGLTYYLGIMALISVSLGVFNLLPIPILDGGRIVFSVVEGIQGKPVSDRIKFFCMQLGLTFLAVVMVMSFYNDILRLLNA